jgi:hypothetical protein
MQQLNESCFKGIPRQLQIQIELKIHQGMHPKRSQFQGVKCLQSINSL